MPEPTTAALIECELERIHEEARIFVRTTVEAWDQVPDEPAIAAATEKVYRVLCDYSPMLRALRRRRRAAA